MTHRPVWADLRTSFLKLCQYGACCLGCYNRMGTKTGNQTRMIENSVSIFAPYMFLSDIIPIRIPKGSASKRSFHSCGELQKVEAREHRQGKHGHECDLQHCLWQMDASQGPAQSCYNTSCCWCHVSTCASWAASTKAWILN